MYRRLSDREFNCLRRLQFRLEGLLGRRIRFIYFVLTVAVLWIISIFAVQQLLMSNIGNDELTRQISLRNTRNIRIKGLECLEKGRCLLSFKFVNSNIDFIKLVKESKSRHQSYIQKMRDFGKEFDYTNYANVRNLTDTKAITDYFPHLKKPKASDTGVEYNSVLGLKLLKEYGLGDKHLPYVEHKDYSSLYSNKSHHYLNSHAVFAGYGTYRMHGILGIFPNGTTPYVFVEKPPKINLENGTSYLGRGGGFYRELSDHLSLDRVPADERDNVCKNVTYPIKDLDDASVIITFYNEPLSTLLRSVHSVLNHTPPPLLREIILVDDGSDMIDLLPGGFLDDYVKLLPKVKVVHLSERTGIVGARLHGIRLSTAPVIVILDSHIETSYQWLEPQLLRLKESKNSVVMPQIDSIDSLDFSYTSYSGIGCRLGFKYSIVEQATLTGKINSTEPIASPVMAGGLFAVRRDFFWKLGGYDQEFRHWGAENVEFSLRIWLCGGKLECVPCSRVFHIFRKKGVGYTSPPNSLWRNRLRTARVWLDEFYEITELFAPNPDMDLGPFDDMFYLKKKLNCKPFKWFLENIAPETYITDINQVLFVGEIKSKRHNNICLDTMNHSTEGERIDNFFCHGQKGTQAFMLTNNTMQIRLVGKENFCIGSKIEFVPCTNTEETSIWILENETVIKAKIKERNDTFVNKCLSLVPNNTSPTKYSVQFGDCNSDDPLQHWEINKHVPKGRLIEGSHRNSTE
ncbi:UDP-N-acetyl-D-galactosamine [Cryptosporidium ryanae]|uniref:UDP-N-acetyl-D-galactosamine n=1 Tax=Cryptosporidium ryanae TaxID=515981 RepID=UPI00351A1E66|nr:UDP-N-acetyl-D-galactosamine [Cryptosporidium ryanae]